MKLARSRRRQAPLVYALYVNAALLLAVLVAVLSRGGGIGGSAALAAPQMPPIAGGGGVFLMPAQFANNVWGCYLMDIDSQNICAYEYLPGAHQLRFVASRNYREDRKLREWNTSPPLADIAQLNQLAKGGIRGAAPGGPGAPADGSGAQPQDQPQDGQGTNEHKDPPGRTDAPPAGPGAGDTNRPSDLVAPPR